MRRQTIAILLAGLVLFGVGIGAALGVIGNEKPSRPATTRQVTGGGTMSGMEPAPSAPPAHPIPGGMTMTGEMSAHAETTEMPEGSMPGMMHTSP